MKDKILSAGKAGKGICEKCEKNNDIEKITLHQLIRTFKLTAGSGADCVLVNTDNESFPSYLRFKRVPFADLFVRICKGAEEEGIDYMLAPILNRKVKDIDTKVGHYDGNSNFILEDKFERDICPESVDLKLVRFPADGVSGPAYQLISDQIITVNGGERTYYPVIVITLEDDLYDNNGGIKLTARK